MLSSVALKYARALAELAGEENRGRQVLDELIQFRELLQGHRQLLEVLVNPALPFAAKRTIVERLAESVPLSRVVVNFILVLLQKARIQQFDQLVGAYERVLDERLGIVHAQIFSTREMEEAVKERLQEAVSRLTGKKAKLRYQLDEELMGGLKMQIGSTVFDGSVRTQLEEIRRRLATE